MSAKHTTWAVIFAIVILLVLAVMPAQAQDIGGATSSALYLPSIERNFVLWFTDEELAQAQADAGYNVDEAQMHTNCILDVTAVPPYLYRFSECSQYFIHGIGATEDADPPHYILWRKLNDGNMHGIEVGG